MTLETLTWFDPDGTSVDLFDTRGINGRMMPPIRYTEDVVPGQPGARLREVQIAPRQVVVPILVDEASTPAYRAALRTMADLLDPTKGEGVLRAVDQEAAVRELHCFYIDGFGIEENYPVHARPSLLFRACDPFWYDAADTQVDYVVGSPATFFPIFPLRLSSSEVFADSAVDNTGKFTWPVWEIRGPGTGVALRNLTSGKLSSLSRPLLAGESATFDTREGVKTITLQDGTNLFPFFSGTLWPLASGSNAIRVEMSGATSDSRVTLRYKRRFLSA